MRATKLFALLLGLGGAALAGPIDASLLPQCATGSASQWQAYTLGCRVGDGPFTISDFSFQFLSAQSSIRPGITPIASALDVTVTPGNSITETLRFGSPKFDIVAPDKVTYQFGYTIDPPPEIIPGFEAEIFAFSPVFPGNATLQTFLCVGAGFVGPNCSGTPVSFTVTHDGNDCDECFGSVQFSSPTNVVGVIQILTLDATRGGSSEITEIGGAVPFLVPEPSTYALFGSGLGALLLLRRRRRS